MSIRKAIAQEAHNLGKLVGFSEGYEAGRREIRTREICQKTGKLCAAGCQTDTNVSGYCYEKERAGDYANPALTERSRIVAWLRAHRNPGGYSYQALADRIERGEHARPEPAQGE